MAKKLISVEVSASAHDVGSAFVKVAKVVKDALADGWDPLSDTSAIVLAAVAELGAVIGKLQHLPSEAIEDAEAFGRAFGNVGFDIWQTLVPGNKA